MELYDIRSYGFVADSGGVVVTATVPDMMVGVVVHARYALGEQDATVTVFLLQSRLGTVTGTLDVVTLNPSRPTFPDSPASPDSVVGVVDPGHVVVARTTAGTVTGRILFGYSLGRTRRP